MAKVQSMAVRWLRLRRKKASYAPLLFLSASVPQNHFGHQFFLELISEGVNYLSINKKYFFYIIEAIFCRLNLRLSQKKATLILHS